MLKWMTLFIFVVALGFLPARAQENPVLVVHACTVASGVSFPYDMKDSQTQAIGEIKAKDGDQFDVVSDAPPNRPVSIYSTAKSRSGTKATRQNGC
jgi:hypothetical protein